MDQSSDGRSGEVELGELLRQREETVAVAESVTGGLLCSRITAVPGASAYFDRGVVPYAYDANREMLGVTREVLDEHGAVSRPVAAELAQRVRDLSSATWGLSVTGLAGPTGGSPEKPVGTTFVGVAYAGEWGSGESAVTVARFERSGNRNEVRAAMVQGAIGVLIDEIESR